MFLLKYDTVEVFMMKLLSFVLSVFLFIQSSFAYIIPQDIQEQIVLVEDFSLNSDQDLPDYIDLLHSLIKKTHEFTDQIFVENKDFNLKKYRMALKRLFKMAQNPEKNLSDNQQARTFFIKTYQDGEEEESLWNQVYDFITSPLGIILSATVAITSVWLFWNNIQSLVNAFLISDSEDEGKEDIEIEFDNKFYLDSLMIVDDGDSDSVVWTKKIILDAIKEKDKEENQDLILNRRNNMGLNALLWASFRGHLDIVKALLGSGLITEKEINVTTNDEYKLTPLMLAIIKNKLEVVRLLVTYKVNENNLLMSKKNLNYKDKLKNATALIMAIMSKKYAAEMTQVILESPHMDEEGLKLRFFDKTPLMLAVSRESYDVFKVLLGYKDIKKIIDLKDSDGNTALALAARMGDIKYVGPLLEKMDQKTINTSNKLGKTPLYYTIDDAKKIESTKAILKHVTMKGFWAQTKSDRTPLFWASYKGNHLAVEELVNHKNMNLQGLHLRNDEGLTPLMVAAGYWGHEKVVKVLLGSKHMDINGIDLVANNSHYSHYYNKTALELAEIKEARHPLNDNYKKVIHIIGTVRDYLIALESGTWSKDILHDALKYKLVSVIYNKKDSKKMVALEWLKKAGHTELRKKILAAIKSKN